MKVDLSSEPPASFLDLKKLEGAELLRVKRHVVEDLLALHEPSVTYPLLGAAAAAVLYPFINGAGRFVLWLVGRTGAGKSFVAKLFMSFFGDFPVSSGRFTSWSATPNFVQRLGYFFKDALYLVDDFKPEVTRPFEVTRILQTYADTLARARLKADATANVLRPIRGLLVSTGEDVPEHQASATARSVIVQVSQRAKNVEAGRRCLAECGNYGGVMADFLRWLLAEGQTGKFTVRFAELQERLNRDVAGQQNDIRVSGNLAQLGAAFELFAEYLGDVWPGWEEEARRFVDEELTAIRGAMLGEAREQQASEVFLRTLGDLVRYGHVRIDGFLPAGMNQAQLEHKQLIGRLQRGRRDAPPQLDAPPPDDLLEISTSLAIGAVSGALRQQGREPLKATANTLLQQLREDGKLLGADGQPLKAEDEASRRIRLVPSDRKGQQRVFTVSRRELLGD